MDNKVKATLLMAALMLSMGLAALTSAASVTPILVSPWTSGNGMFEADSIGYEYGYKIDEWDTGGMDGTYSVSYTHNSETIAFTITISNSDGYTFDWSSTNPIWAVIVVSAGNATIFEYDPPSTSDTELYAPHDKEISHVTFCWNYTEEEPEPGTIIVEKQTVPDGDPTIFNFSGDAAGSISDGEQIVVTGLAPGNYTSIEGVPDGWTLTSISVNDSDSITDLASGTVILLLDEGETVKAVFTNEKVEEPEDCTIIVRKEIDWGLESNYTNHPMFNFTIVVRPIGLLYPFSLGDGESMTFSGLSPGEYEVIEDLMGWNPSEIKITGGGYNDTVHGDTVTVEIEAGETITITFINRPPDFVIPEVPWGVLGAMLTMLTALALLVNKRGITLKP